MGAKRADGGYGSIPAHAGEPFRSRFRSHSLMVYPRPRGGTAESPVLKGRAQGLSPPTRGNRRKPRAEGARAGSIPAHAGEPLE